MPEQELANLLAQCALGNRKAFETLYQQASPKIYGLMLRLLKDDGLAQDALQEGFVHIWHHASEYQESKGQPMAWMATIVRYRGLDILRREGSQTSRKNAFETEQSVLSDTYFSLEQAFESDLDIVELNELQECMDLLEADQRESVMLAYYYGFSHSEMVKRLKRPLGTIKSWIRRGMESVRECMQP